MFITLRRIFRFGWQGFIRNKGLSFGVIFIMTIVILGVSSLGLFKKVSDALISEVRKKVDISVYFKSGTSEEDIMRIKESLYKFSPGIIDVDYVSSEEAHKSFLERHQKDPLYLQALAQVGGNPFLPSLDIKARSPDLYAQIATFLTQGPFKNAIEKVSYYQNKTVINRLFALTRNIKVFGILLSIGLIFLTALVIFATIKLTIFAFEDKITTMRLVGASNWFIRGPFVVQSLLYGFFAVAFANLLLFLTLSAFNQKFIDWFFNFDILNYFKSAFPIFLLWQLVFASLVGFFSSLIAMRKYLKV